MIVVADTTPLQYLILIQYEHILPALYGRVVVPPAVIAELTRDETPLAVREWLASAPGWLEVRRPREVGLSSVPLGAGELEAIAFDLRIAVDRLRRTNFRANEELFQWLLAREKPKSDR